MVTFKAPSSAVSIRFGNIPPASQLTSRGLNKVDLPLSWRLNNEKKLREFRRASAAVQRSQTYKLKKTGQGTNPIGLKGWASLVEERIEAARQQGHFRNLKGRGKPLILANEERNPFISREEFFMNRIIKKNNAAPPWVELQTAVDATLSSFRQILVSTWVRHAVRQLCMQDANSLGEMQPDKIASFRDIQWESRENSFQVVALEEVNSAIRNYNHVAPYAVRKTYIDLPGELDKAYKESQALIQEELASRKARANKVFQPTRGRTSDGASSPKHGPGLVDGPGVSVDSLWVQFRRWVSHKFSK